MGGVIKAAAAVCALAVGETYRYVYCRERGPLRYFMDKHSHPASYYIARDTAAEELRTRRHIRLELKTPDGRRLSGFYYPCGDSPCGRVAYIVHGYRSEHAQTAGLFAPYYHGRGFDLFCPDNTASGESGGRLIGYGIYESRDCLQWLERLRAEFGGDIEIALHGFSMGGAAVLSLSDRAPRNVKFIVSDSGFSNAHDLLRVRLGAMFVPVTLLNRLLTGCTLAQTDVRPHLRRASVPILFVHGEEDVTVPTAMGRELYKLCPTQKDSLFVPHARHIESIFTAPEAYAAKLDKFIGKYI